MWRHALANHQNAAAQLGMRVQSWLQSACESCYAADSNTGPDGQGLDATDGMEPLPTVYTVPKQARGGVIGYRNR